MKLKAEPPEPSMSMASVLTMMLSLSLLSLGSRTPREFGPQARRGFINTAAKLRLQVLGTGTYETCYNQG